MLCQFCNNVEVRCKVCLGILIRKKFSREAVLASLIKEHNLQHNQQQQQQQHNQQGNQGAASPAAAAEQFRISADSDKDLFGGDPQGVHSVKTRAIVSIVHGGLVAQPKSKTLVFSEWRTYLTDLVLPALRAAFNVTLFDNRAPRKNAAASSSSVASSKDETDDDVQERPAKRQKRQKQWSLSNGDDSDAEEDSDGEPMEDERPRSNKSDVIDLDKRDLTVFQFYGGMTKAAADRMRAAFVAYKGAAVMLVTSKAGGVGLNLAGEHINTLINAEQPWNPAELEQQVARACRIGQTDVVNVYRLRTDNSVDSSVARLHSRKLDLGNFLVHQTEITNDEIKAAVSSAAALSASKTGDDIGVVGTGMASDPMIDVQQASRSEKRESPGVKRKRESQGLNAISAFDALDTVFKELIDAYKSKTDKDQESEGDDM
jgi:hypothetical protein